MRVRSRKPPAANFKKPSSFPTRFTRATATSWGRWLT